MIIPLEKPGTPQDLLHFGTKGMKWGVRKERTSNPALKKQAMKVYAKKTDPLVEVRVRQMLDMSDLTMNDYKRLSTRQPFIPKGKTIYRVADSPDFDSATHSYVTVNKRDAEVYRGLIPALRMFDPIRKSDYKPHYEMTFQSKKTLRGPSEKERVDILAGLMDKPNAVQGKFGVLNLGQMSLRQYLRNGKIISRKEFKNDSELDLALKMHRRIHQDMGSRKSPITRAYLKEISDKGYDIVSDDWDSGVLSKNPMIILDPKKATHKQKTRALSNDDILRAQINLKFPERK